LRKIHNMKEIAEQIQAIMIAHSKTLSTAESCTSGRIAALLTTISGASNYFQGGLVAYQDHLKVQYLGVSPEDIERYDVVSQPVVEQMVRGACQLFGTDFALASTGYAGTGTERIPSGTIWIGWGSQDDVHSLCLTEDNGREANTQHAVDTVLQEFLKYLKERIK